MRERGGGGGARSDYVVTWCQNRALQQAAVRGDFIKVITTLISWQ